MESNENDASVIVASVEALEPASEVVPFPVHPFAASFPMLDGEELDALVDDIRSNGLQHPIVLDTAGQLIDGRNRLKACELAGVTATYTTTEIDPIAYILGANVNRRHLSKGQCAMAYAMAYPDGTKGGRGRKNPEVTSEFSAIQLSERDDVREAQTALDQEQADIDKRISRLVAAIETGGDLPSLVARQRELEARKVAIAQERASLRPVPRLAPAVIENRLAEWRRLLRQSTTQGRIVLQRIIRGRLTFTPRPDGDGCDFTGPTRFDRLFAGIAAPRPAWTETHRHGL